MPAARWSGSVVDAVLLMSGRSLLSLGNATLTLAANVILDVILIPSPFDPRLILRIAPAVLGWPDAGAAYTAVLQLVTLAAVVGFFLRDLLGIGA